MLDNTQQHNQVKKSVSSFLLFWTYGRLEGEPVAAGQSELPRAGANRRDLSPRKRRGEVEEKAEGNWEKDAESR